MQQVLEVIPGVIPFLILILHGLSIYSKAKKKYERNNKLSNRHKDGMGGGRD